MRSAPDALLREENACAAARARAQIGEAAFATAATVGGQEPVEAAIAVALGGALPPGLAPRPSAKAERLGLTPRELEVAQLVVRGLSNRAIAAELVISEQTAETHVKRILSKLGVSSRTQAAARAAELGLLAEPGSLA